MNKITLFVLFTIMMVWSAQGAASNRVVSNRVAGLFRDNELMSTVRELLDSFMDGANVENVVVNSTKCVRNFEVAFDDISGAVSKFVSAGWSWDNYLALNGALGDLTPLVRVCWNVTDISVASAREHFSRFTGLVDFFNQAKNNALGHFFDWYDIYTKITDAINRSRDKDIAYQVGRAVRLILDFKPAMTYQATDLSGVDLPDLRPFEDFLKGFLNGTRILSSDRIKNCVNETDFIVTSIEDANRQFQKGTTEGFREGVLELTDIFAHLRPLNDQCFNGYIDIQAIITKYIKTFTSPLDILINAARHFNQIYIDALGALQHCKNSLWRDCGKDVGDVFYNVFFSQ